MKNFAHLYQVFIWWFTHGVRNFWQFLYKQIKLTYYGFSIRILWKNLLEPLYGAGEKFYERLISIFVRFFHFLILFLIANIFVVAIYILAIGFLISPFLPIYFIYTQNYATAVIIYIFTLTIYFLLKEKTKPNLKKQLSKKEPKDLLTFASREINTIFRQKKSLQEKVQNILKSPKGERILIKLELNNININLLEFNHHQDTLLKNALKNAYNHNKTHINMSDIIEALWQLRKKEDPFWKNIKLKKHEIGEFFVLNAQRTNLYKFQQEWASYAFFQNKYGIDKGLTSALTRNVNEYTRDTTRNRSSSSITPLVGRAKEWQQIIDTLKYKGGASLLIGPSGVGKSRIIEHLAEEVAVDHVPNYLHDMRVVELDSGRILSSNNPSSSLIGVLDEVSSSKHIILTIDNLISLSGDDFASISLLNILSKYIENKQIRLIATSTSGDYSRFLNNHPSHIRWFTKIFLEEPNDANLKKILYHHALNLEKKHNTICTHRVFTTLLEASKKHASNVSHPAKSLQLLEETFSNNTHKNYITSEDIKKTLEKNTGIKITDIQEDEKEKLSNLEGEIHKTIVAQDDAVNKVSDALRRARLDLHDYESPIAKFLFVGPTGVGKTELAKTVARIHFGSEKNMLRLDMSEYQDTKAIERLIGDGQNPGALTEPVKNKAHILILLDEIEKAHPNILHLFLQLLDDGRLTDGKGVTIDFRNTIIIATSNAGAEYLWDSLKKNLEFKEVSTKLHEEILPKHFKPEFLNRFSYTTIFHPLNEEQIFAIAKKLLIKNKNLFKEKGLNIEFTKDAPKIIAQDAFSIERGARPLKNLIVERLESQIAKSLLQNKDAKNFIFDGKNLKTK